MKSTWRLVMHAARTVFARPFQSLLLMICGGAGVLSLLVVAGLSSGVERQLQLLISDWKNQRLISAFGRRTKSPDGRICERNTLSNEDLQALRREIAGATFYPRLSMPVRIDTKGSHRRVDVSAVGLEYFRFTTWFTAWGDPLDEDDEVQTRRVAVIGSSLARQLFTNPESAVGETLRINGFPFRVKGVLEPRGLNVIGEDRDQVLFIPVSTATKRALCIEGLRGIGYSVERIEDEASLRARIREILRARHDLTGAEEDDFGILDSASLRTMYTSAFRTKRLLGIALTCIATVIAAGLIANVTFLSIQQRRSEIGLKRALGATRPAIATEVLSEAFILSVCGAAVGLVLYTIPVALVPRLTAVAPGFATFPLDLSWQTFIYALALGIVIGALAGWAPALRAARLDPVVALRQ